MHHTYKTISMKQSVLARPHILINIGYMHNYCTLFIEGLHLFGMKRKWDTMHGSKFNSMEFFLTSYITSLSIVRPGILLTFSICVISINIQSHKCDVIHLYKINMNKILDAHKKRYGFRMWSILWWKIRNTHLQPQHQYPALQSEFKVLQWCICNSCGSGTNYY